MILLTDLQMLKLLDKLHKNNWQVSIVENVNLPISKRIEAVRENGNRIVIPLNTDKITPIVTSVTVFSNEKSETVHDITEQVLYDIISNRKDERINIYRAEKAYIDILQSLQKLSTCCRLKVAALLVRDGRIVATGWNGVASGQRHCEEIFKECSGNSDFYEKHHEFSTRYELHAEQNLVSFCAKNGIETNGTTIYLTHSPCIHCAKILLSAGIKEVKFLELYDRDKSGVELLAENHVPCSMLKNDTWEIIVP